MEFNWIRMTAAWLTWKDFLLGALSSQSEPSWHRAGRVSSCFASEVKLHASFRDQDMEEDLKIDEISIDLSLFWAYFAMSILR